MPAPLMVRPAAAVLLGIGMVAVGAMRAVALQVAQTLRVDTTGPAIRFDFAGMRIGVAEYEAGPTGTTVFYFPKGVKAAVDVRGGAPGTINTDAIRLGYESPMMQAVVFSGGSWYGLSAATGVANEIKTMRADSGEIDFIAGVVGAIIYDVGGRRFTRITPDDRLGRAAVRAAREGWFPLGARGAGRFAMQGVYFASGRSADRYAIWPHSGQGGAFRQVGPTKIAVFTVVNALGTVVGRDGRVVRCHRNSDRASCPLADAMLQNHLLRAAGGGDGTAAGPSGNTTITLVVTNQRLLFWALQRLAVQVHTSMARAIQPFATEDDGDALYAVTTDEVDNPSLAPIDLGAVASEVVWDAILASVPPLPPAPRDPIALPSGVPAGLIGRYAFAGGGALMVESTDRLRATFTGRGRIYFDDRRRYDLIPVGVDVFRVDAPGNDLVRFDRQDGAVIGLTLNPGPWSQTAIRTQEAGAPTAFLGEWEDDYGNQYRIDAGEWVQRTHGRFRIEAWHLDEQYLIAQNDPANRSAPGKWTRIDWVRLDGMPPYRWGYCLTAWDALTADAARAAPGPDRDATRTGCGGHPFSRMRTRQAH